MRREQRDERLEPNKVAGLSESSEPARSTGATSQGTRAVLPRCLRNSRNGSLLDVVPLDSESPATLSDLTVKSAAILALFSRRSSLVCPPCLRASVVNCFASVRGAAI